MKLTLEQIRNLIGTFPEQSVNPKSLLTFLLQQDSRFNNLPGHAIEELQQIISPNINEDLNTQIEEFRKIDKAITDMEQDLNRFCGTLGRYFFNHMPNLSDKQKLIDKKQEEIQKKQKYISMLVKQISEKLDPLYDLCVDIDCITKLRHIYADPTLALMLGADFTQHETTQYCTYVCNNNIAEQKKLFRTKILAKLQQISSEISSKLDGVIDSNDLLTFNNNQADILANKLLGLLNTTTYQKTDPAYIATISQFADYKKTLSQKYSDKFIGILNSKTQTTIFSIIANKPAPLEIIQKVSNLDSILRVFEAVDQKIPMITHALRNTLQATNNNDGLMSSFWKSLPPVIKNMIGLVFQPWITYYSELSQIQENLKFRHRYTYFEKTKFAIKFTLPIIALIITIACLAPIYNDLLVVIITPIIISFGLALMKEIIKGCKKLLDIIYGKKEFDINKRVTAIFSPKNDKIVTRFYETRVSKTTEKISKLNEKPIPERRTDDINKFPYLSQKLKELKKEWRIIHDDDLAYRNTDDSMVRELLIFRITKIIERKCEKQKLAFLKQAEQVYAEAFKLKIENKEEKTTPSPDHSVPIKPIDVLRQLRREQETIDAYNSFGKSILEEQAIPPEIALELKIKL